MPRGAPKSRVADTLFGTYLFGAQFACPLLFGKDIMKFSKSIGKWFIYVCMDILLSIAFNADGSCITSRYGMVWYAGASPS